MAGSALGEVEVTEALVRSLLRDQHPDLAGRPIELVEGGWDHMMARLGETPERPAENPIGSEAGSSAGATLGVRLPRRRLGARMIAHEQRFLVEHGAMLPLPVPVPLRTGQPTSSYPYHWSVVPWLPGRPATLDPPGDDDRAAVMLGRFLGALHRPAPDDAPHNPFRGVPLADRVGEASGDGVTGTFDQRLDQAGSLVHREQLRQVMDEALTAPPWPGRPVWCHGDLHPRNILVEGGQVSAVIDFSDVCGGDPAVDAIIAWLLLDPAVHATFRHQTHTMDDHTWTRGKGWALHLSLTIYLGSDDVAFRHVAARALDRLADV